MSTQWMSFRIRMSQRVDTGIRYLATHYPDWISRIDLAELDEGNEVNCVYGQVTGEVFQQTELGTKLWEAEDLGMFLRPTQCPDNMLGMGYKILTEIWSDRIEELRSSLTTNNTGESNDKFTMAR